MRDLELWLEAAPGSIVPPECYAAVRPGDAQPLGPPTYCAAQKASFLGAVGEREGPVVVDIFQRVGSINLGLVEPGALAEALVAWPGVPLGELLRLRVAVVAVDLAPTAEEPAPTTPQAQPEPAVPVDGLLAARPGKREIPTPEGVETPRKRVGAFVAPLAVSEPPTPHQPPTPSLAALHAGLSLRSPRVSPREDRPQRPYKPIVLNNCDQIIPNLYLGGIAAASDTQQLVQQGIRAVCCCVRELEFPTTEFHHDVAYYRVDVEDISREPIEIFFPEATEFIHSWVSREQPVLVHCRAGVSRSASVVIAYLITYHGYSLHDAFFLVRSHRSIVTPNIGFMEKLGYYEEAKRGTEPTIDINKYVSWFEIPERAAVPDLKPD